MKNRALWIVIPLLLWLGLEMVSQRLDQGSYARAAWYEGALDRSRSGPIDFIFIGTSRTASAILPHVWEKEIREATGSTVHCRNLGRAFSGSPAHHFGLRELVQRHPETMRDCTVFIETTHGIPTFVERWEDKWFFPGNTQLAVDYMNRSDLWRYLRGPHDFESKAGVLGRYLGRFSNLVSGRRQLQQQFDWRVNRLTKRALHALGATEPETSGAALPAHRQLRQDRAGIALQRDLVRERTSPDILAAQEPLLPWEHRVVCQTVEMLKENDVEVVFFEMPAPSYVDIVNGTEVRRADRHAFAEWRTQYGLPLLETDLEVDDEDFPDLSHLAANRIEDYTKALARAFVKSPGKRSTSP